MSNLNIYNSSKKLKNIKLCIITAALIITSSLISCKSNTGSTSNIDTDDLTYEKDTNPILSDEDLKIFKSHVEKRIDNIETIKNEDDSEYIIIENFYEKMPVYGIDENGNKYVKYYDEQVIFSQKYTISFENSEKLNLTELLDSKLIGYSKTK